MTSKNMLQYRAYIAQRLQELKEQREHLLDKREELWKRHLHLLKEQEALRVRKQQFDLARATSLLSSMKPD